MFIISVFIDSGTCLHVWFQTICGMYKNWTYVFASPARFSKVVVRVLVEYKFLLISIYCFSWYKIYSGFISQDFLSWFLNCVNLIYWISSPWSKNFFWGVIGSFIWDKYKSDIQILFSASIVEVLGEGDGCVVSLFIINLLTGWKSIISFFSCSLLLSFFNSRRGNKERVVFIYWYYHQSKKLILMYIVSLIFTSDIGVQLRGCICLVWNVWWSIS